jgi:hypothetical protein
MDSASRILNDARVGKLPVHGILGVVGEAKAVTHLQVQALGPT